MEPVLAGVREAAGLGGLEGLTQERHVAVQLRALRRRPWQTEEAVSRRCHVQLQQGHVPLQQGTVSVTCPEQLS